MNCKYWTGRIWYSCHWYQISSSMWLLIHMTACWRITGISGREKTHVILCDHAAQAIIYVWEVDVQLLWPKQQGYFCNHIKGTLNTQKNTWLKFIFAFQFTFLLNVCHGLGIIFSNVVLPLKPHIGPYPPSAGGTKGNDQRLTSEQFTGNSNDTRKWTLTTLLLTERIRKAIIHMENSPITSNTRLLPLLDFLNRKEHLSSLEETVPLYHSSNDLES